MTRRSQSARTVRKRLTSAVRPTRGRPPVHTEPWTKVSVVLFRRQVELLDELRRRVAREHRLRVSRAGLIRVAIEQLQHAVSVQLTSRMLSAFAEQSEPAVSRTS